MCRRGVGDVGQPDPLDASGLLVLQGGEAGPNLNPGINLSPGVVASETAGGLPFSTQVAGVLGTAGSGANTILLVGAGVVAVTLGLLATKGRRG